MLEVEEVVDITLLVEQEVLVVEETELVMIQLQILVLLVLVVVVAVEVGCLLEHLVVLVVQVS